MQQHVSFLLALRADPCGDLNRLVYADWLEDQGHPLAELLRLQVAIRELPEASAQVLVLADREQTVLARHASAFVELGQRLTRWSDAQTAYSDGVIGLSRRHPARFDCPACHGDSSYRWDVKNPMVLHWVLNPGLAVNELLLGQRVPKVLLFCRACRTATIRCPVCRRHLNSEFVAPFGNWAGIHCPECGSAIPTLRNALAGLVVGLGKLATGRLPWKKAARVLLPLPGEDTQGAGNVTHALTQGQDPCIPEA
jgi:uncharacterized protein (TIGR02996 family)